METASIHRERSRPLSSTDEREANVSLVEGDRPLRIALVHTSDQGGGAEASTLSLHLALRKLGHESFLFVGSKQSDHPDVIEIPRFRCLPGVLRAVQMLEHRTGWQYLYHPWFRQVDRLFPPNLDVVHFQSLWGGQHGFADVGGLPRLTKRFPSLMTLRDLWMLTGHCACPPLDCDRWQRGCGRCPDLGLAPAIPQDGTAFNWSRKRRAITRSKLRVITVSNWLGQVVRQSPIFAGKEIHTIYNGVDESIFTPGSKAEARARWGLPQDATIVMLAGQSVEGTSGNGTGATDYALRSLMASERKLFLLAVGRSAERVLQSWGRPGMAVPFQSDSVKLAELYNAADFVVVASLWETFGRIPAEAQMCGVPVAGFATGGIPEVVQHDVTGWLVPRQDSDGLALAVRTLADQSDLRQSMGDAAVPRARRLFSHHAIAMQHVQHYREVIAQRHGTTHGEGK